MNMDEVIEAFEALIAECDYIEYSNAAGGNFSSLEQAKKALQQLKAEFQPTPYEGPFPTALSKVTHWMIPQPPIDMSDTIAIARERLPEARSCTLDFIYIPTAIENVMYQVKFDRIEFESGAEWVYAGLEKMEPSKE